MPAEAEYCYEYPCHGPHQQRWFRFRAARFAGDGPIRVIVSHEEITALRDITSRRQVRNGRARLHELSRRLVAAQALERRQIAGDLHDQIGQNLAVLLEEVAR